MDKQCVCVCISTFNHIWQSLLQGFGLVIKKKKQAEFDLVTQMLHLLYLS